MNNIGEIKHLLMQGGEKQKKALELIEGFSIEQLNSIGFKDFQDAKDFNFPKLCFDPFMHETMPQVSINGENRYVWLISEIIQDKGEIYRNWDWEKYGVFSNWCDKVGEYEWELHNSTYVDPVSFSVDHIVKTLGDVKEIYVITGCYFYHTPMGVNNTFTVTEMLKFMMGEVKRFHESYKVFNVTEKNITVYWDRNTLHTKNENYRAAIKQYKLLKKMCVDMNTDLRISITNTGIHPLCIWTNIHESLNRQSIESIVNKFKKRYT